MHILFYYILAALISLVTIIVWAYIDHKLAPPGHDEYCSKIDDELNSQGK